MNITTLKQTIACLLIMLSCTVLAQEKGRISGTVILSDNAPAENISVVLKQTSYAAITDGQGGYEIRNVQPGTY
ncbi:MAG: carboxypeptidase regulatory-like domain-containing protein, partial [Flavobacterium sp.]